MTFFPYDYTYFAIKFPINYKPPFANRFFKHITYMYFVIFLKYDLKNKSNYANQINIKICRFITINYELNFTINYVNLRRIWYLKSSFYERPRVRNKAEAKHRPRIFFTGKGEVPEHCTK